MDGFQQRSSRLTQLIDGIQLQDGVVHHDTAGHDDTDGRHQVQRMAEDPQCHQCEGNVNRDFNQHDERLQEAFELGTQDKVHQQNADKQNHGQFAHHLFIREEASGEIHFPTVGFIHRLLHLFNQVRSIGQVIETHRDILTVLARRNALQVFRRYHLNQTVQRNKVRLSLFIALCPHQSLCQYAVDALLLSGNAHRQILLIGTQGGNRVFLERRAEYTGQFRIRHIIEQQSFTIHDNVHLVTESDTFRFHTGMTVNPVFQLL